MIHMRNLMGYLTTAALLIEPKQISSPNGRENKSVSMNNLIVPKNLPEGIGLLSRTYYRKLLKLLFYKSVLYAISLCDFKHRTVSIKCLELIVNI